MHPGGKLVLRLRFCTHPRPLPPGTKQGTVGRFTFCILKSAFGLIGPWWDSSAKRYFTQAWRSHFQPKLSSAKCRLNVENFITACRKLGVPEVKSHQDSYIFILSMHLNLHNTLFTTRSRSVPVCFKPSCYSGQGWTDNGVWGLFVLIHSKSKCQHPAHFSVQPWLCILCCPSLVSNIVFSSCVCVCVSCPDRCVCVLWCASV